MKAKIFNICGSNLTSPSIQGQKKADSSAQCKFLAAFNNSKDIKYSNVDIFLTFEVCDDST